MILTPDMLSCDPKVLLLMIAKSFPLEIIMHPDSSSSGHSSESSELLSDLSNSLGVRGFFCFSGLLAGGVGIGRFG